MAHQFTDTFCTITLSAQAPYEIVSGSITYSSAFARFTPPAGCAGGGAQIAANASLRKNLLSNQSTLITFLSAGQLAMPLSSQSSNVSWWDNGTCQVFLAVLPNGSLQFYRGGGGGTPVGSPSASGLIGPASGTKPNTGIETMVTFSGSVGQVKCWLNGTNIISSAANLNTIQTVNAYANQVQLVGGSGGGAGGSNQGIYCDYLRVWDGTGATQNAPIGTDRQPVTKLPSGAGVNTSWSANGLGSNYQCVSVIPPNATDYVSANGTNVIDDYAMPNAGLTTAPSQVVSTSYYFKDDSATRTYTNGVLSSGVPSVGSTFTANSSATWVQNCIPYDPNLPPTTPWTAASADAAHFLHEELT